MIPRRLLPVVDHLLDRHSAVAILGPRQVGKTTLPLAIAAERPSVYLDLEVSSDLAKIADAELYRGSSPGGGALLLPDVCRS